MGSWWLNCILISDRIGVLQAFEILYRLIQNCVVRRSYLWNDKRTLALVVVIPRSDLKRLVHPRIFVVKVEFLQSFPQMLVLREVLGIFLLVVFVPDWQVSFWFIASLALRWVPKLDLQLALSSKLSGVIAHQRLLEWTFRILCLHQRRIGGIC